MRVHRVEFIEMTEQELAGVLKTFGYSAFDRLGADVDHHWMEQASEAAAAHIFTTLLP